MLLLTLVLETDAKKIRLAQILPQVKNLQFLYNQAHSQAILPTHELVISTKFHKDWQKIVDFFIKSEVLIQSNFCCISL